MTGLEPARIVIPDSVPFVKLDGVILLVATVAGTDVVVVEAADLKKRHK